MKGYLVLARKYRPQTFAEIVGQAAIVQTLQNTIKSGKIGHAYLFSGPRGVGKTTAARIFAKAVNCDKGPSVEPCLKCSICQEIASGTAMDILEIDGASNRGIDEIRALRENVKFAPAYARYKIYIIDEVHQVTEAGFNALLKTLEEPPNNVIFIFATTEPQNIPETILSRCQRFNFKLISASEIIEQLSNLAHKEKIDITPEALTLISQAAEGSMRDGLSIFDQIISFIGPGKKIEEAQVRSILGITSQELLLRFSQNIFTHKTLETIELVNVAQEAGFNLHQLTKDLRLHFRNLLMAKISAQPQELISLSDETIQLMSGQVESLSVESLLHYVDIISRLENELKYADQPRIVLEAGLIKLTRPYIAIDDLMKRLESLEKGMVPDDQAPENEDSSLESEDCVEVMASKPIAKEWRLALEEVRRKKPTLAVCLDEAYPKTLEGKFLLLEFKAQSKFQKETIERSENLKIVEDAATQAWHKPIRIKCVFSEETAVKTEMAPDPIVEQVLSVFDGEIVTNKKENKQNGFI